tara:strand:+ start:132 stop:431 length:300 start_codon:yes stop_codon:yes gene_type:complete
MNKTEISKIKNSSTWFAKSKTKKNKKNTKSARQLFKSIDVNNDGNISLYEFIQWHHPKLRRKFESVDINGNGLISFKEFKKWYVNSKIDSKTKLKNIMQ